METTLIVIDSDAELARARALVDRLMASDKPADLARLAAQARLIVAYEEQKWPARYLSAAEAIRYLMDQHGLKRADLVPLLGSAERVDGILRGRRHLTLTMVQRLRAALACRPICCRRPLRRGRPGVRQKRRPRRDHSAACARAARFWASVVMVVAALAVEEVIPGRGGHVRAAVDILQNFI